MRIDGVSTSGIWVHQVQCLRDLICSKNMNTGNTCFSLQVYPFPRYVPYPHHHKNISHSVIKNTIYNRINVIKCVNTKDYFL